MATDLRYVVWIKGSRRPARGPNLLYSGRDKGAAWGAYGWGLQRLRRGRIEIDKVVDGRYQGMRAERRGAR